MALIAPFGMWSIFIIFALILLCLDFTVFHKKDKKIGFKDSIFYTLFYMGMAFLFGIWIWQSLGFHSFSEYITGFMVEQSLAIDNIFIIYLIFSSLKIPEKYQHRVLFWGVLGAIILRGVAIIFANHIIDHFSWMMDILSIIMILTGIKIFLIPVKQWDVTENKLLKWLSKFFHTTLEITDHRFLIKKTDAIADKTYFVLTPLLVALIMVEFTDIIFALDSIPAIFTITKNPFIVYSSNIFAVLGLRSLYFVVAPMVNKFYYLKYSIALILIFIGSKLFIPYFTPIEEISPMISLAVTLGLLFSGLMYSFYKNNQKS